MIGIVAGFSLVLVMQFSFSEPLRRVRSSFEKAYAYARQLDELQSSGRHPLDEKLITSILKEIRKIEKEIPAIPDTIVCHGYAGLKLKDVLQSFTAHYANTEAVRRMMTFRDRSIRPRDDMTDELLAITFELDVVLGSPSSKATLQQMVITILFIVLIASVPIGLIILGIERKGIWYVVAAVVYCLLSIVVIKILVAAGRGPWGGYKL